MNGSGRPQHGRPSLPAGPQFENDQRYSLDHDQGADQGGEHARGGLRAAGEVIEAVPDDDQQDAAAGTVIQPGEDNGATAPKSARRGRAFPVTRTAISAIPRNAAGLRAASHQRRGTRHRTTRASRSPTPGRPMVHAVTTTAAIAGPSSIG